MRDQEFEDDPDFGCQVTEHVGGMVIHRSYDPDRDGWRQHQIKPGEYPVISHARQVLDMAAEINYLRRELWEAQKELKKEWEHVNRMFGVHPEEENHD